jgi:hypothetical protein
VILQTGDRCTLKPRSMGRVRRRFLGKGERREHKGSGAIKVLLTNGRPTLGERLAGLLVSYGGSEITYEPLAGEDALALAQEKQPDVSET